MDSVCLSLVCISRTIQTYRWKKRPLWTTNKLRVPPPFPGIWRMAHQKILKLSCQIDLVVYIKSCARLKVPKCCLVWDFGVAIGKNDSTFRPRFSEALCSIELKLFLQVLDTAWGGYFFGFLISFVLSIKKSKYPMYPKKLLLFY